jgi:hypothetical protein
MGRVRRIYFTLICTLASCLIRQVQTLVLLLGENGKEKIAEGFYPTSLNNGLLSRCSRLATAYLSHSYYSSALATSYAKASLAQFRSRSTKGDFMVSVVENIVLRQ